MRTSAAAALPPQLVDECGGREESGPEQTRGARHGGFSRHVDKGLEACKSPRELEMDVGVIEWHREAAARLTEHPKESPRAECGRERRDRGGRSLGPAMRNYPYEHAPRLPEGDSIDPRTLFHPTPSAPGGAEHAEDAAASLPLAASGAPIELEVGPGRGWFIFERLDHAPEVRVIGLEIRSKWATIVDDRLKKRGYSTRGRVFAEDAKAALMRFVPDSVAVAYVHFPNPWWKKRHAKRLVVDPELLDQLARVLVSGGELLIQTDVEERAEQYEAIVAEHGAFEALEGGAARVVNHPHGARSPRERKAIEDGLPVYRLRYRRVAKS